MAVALSASPVDDEAFTGAEAILERLDLAEEALANLSRIACTDEDRFLRGDGWAARVDLDDTIVLLRSDGERWEILAPPGSDEADAALAARKLHGLLGATVGTWDHDR